MNDEFIFRTLVNRATAEERAEVSVWRSKADGNERRYRDLERVLELANKAQEMRTSRSRPSAKEIVRLASDRTGPRSTRFEGLYAVAGRATRWLAGSRERVAVGVSVLALLIAGFLAFPVYQQWTAASFGVEQFLTGPEERATLVLSDGTVVRLGPQSRLEVVSSNSKERTVFLTGRAFFAVAHDKTRPFRVNTGAGEIDVLGTRFALESSAEDLDVSVVEGEVALTSQGQYTAVRARERAKVMNGAPLPAVSTREAVVLPEWVGVFLAFQETPLRNAVREIEAIYGLQIEILDPTLGDRTITASFTDWPVEDVVEAVCTVVSAHCEVQDTVITMQAGN